MTSGHRAARSRLALLTLTALLITGATAAPVAAAPSFRPAECRDTTFGEDLDDGTTHTMHRYSGPNRYDTSVCVSYWTWAAWDDETSPGSRRAQAVVLASGEAFPDALAAGPLAALRTGPLLLNPKATLAPQVRQEINRVLRPGGTVYLVGSTGALSASVERALTGYATVRIGGADRFETAVKIAEHMVGTERVFVTTGTNFPDALAAGAYATMYTHRSLNDVNENTHPMPLLFTNGTRMPARTKAHIDKRLSANGTMRLHAAGGDGATALRSARYDPGLVYAYVGGDRYETAALIAEELYVYHGNSGIGGGVGLANGTNFPDGLSATAMLMHTGRPLLLTPADSLAPATTAFLADQRQTRAAVVEVFGGAGVLAEHTATGALIQFMQ